MDESTKRKEERPREPGNGLAASDERGRFTKEALAWLAEATETATGGEPLPTAPLAARARRAMGVHHHVAQLPGEPVGRDPVQQQRSAVAAGGHPGGER